jgi:hypothetical protein
LKATVLAATTLAALTATSGSAGPSDSVRKLRDVSLELVGEVTNTPPGVTPASSTQVGYLSYVVGLTAFKGEPANETTALFTFYAQLPTVRVISNGPLRIITRLGTFTIYRDLSANSRFGEPDTFRDGRPILVVNIRQQAVLDTVSGTFTTLNRNTITAAKPFAAGTRRFEVGVVGEKFNTVLTGHLNMPGPPSGYFAGYTVTLR